MSAGADRDPTRAAPVPSGPVALIVGGAGGIGRAVAGSFARRGYRVALVDLDPARLEKAMDILDSPACARTYPCDITDEGAREATYRAVLDDFGRLDVLVHSAGLTHVSPFRSTEPAVIRRVLEVNFLGVVGMTGLALEELIARRGRIVVLSSICGFAPLLGRAGYCASKHALHGFFDTLRAELVDEGVSVLLVCPSFVDTDFATRGLGGKGERLGFERSTSGRPIAADRLAEAITLAALHRRRMLVPSGQGKLAYWLSRLAPSLYERLMARRFRVELERESMRDE